jgi:hypothetical protein
MIQASAIRPEHDLRPVRVGPNHAYKLKAPALTSWWIGSADHVPSVGGETVEQTIAACGDQVLLPTAPRDMR